MNFGFFCVRHNHFLEFKDIKGYIKYSRNSLIPQYCAKPNQLPLTFADQVHLKFDASHLGKLSLPKDRQQTRAKETCSESLRGKTVKHMNRQSRQFFPAACPHYRSGAKINQIHTQFPLQSDQWLNEKWLCSPFLNSMINLF